MIQELFCPSFNYWSLLENLIAGTIVAGAFGYLFPMWLRYYNKPKLIILSEELGGNIKIKEDHTFEANLLLLNKGPASVDKYNWKILVPEAISIEASSCKIQENMARLNVFGGYNQNVIFPKHSHVLLKIKGKYPEEYDVMSLKIYYEVSTEYGRHPETANDFYGDLHDFTDYSSKNLEKLGTINFISC